MIAIAIALLGGLTTTSITAEGWAAASVVTNGNTVSYTYPSDTLPAILAVEIIDTNATRVQLQQSASRRKNQSGYDTHESTVAVAVKYKLETSDSSPGSTVWLKSSFVGVASASGHAEYSGATSNSLAICRNVKAQVGPLDCNFGNSPLEPADSTPPSWKVTLKFTNVTWTNGGLGKETHQLVPMSLLTAFCKAYWPGGSGNSIACSSASSAISKYFPLSFTTGTIVLLSGSMNCPEGDLYVQIYTSANVFVDQWIADITSSDYSFPPELSSGDYKLYFHVPGSLRKRIDITYDASTGASGVNGTLIFGDLDGDNYVSQTEVDFVYGKIGTSVSYGQWNPYEAYAVGDCDFNRDGTVNSTDYNLVSGNVGIYGD